MHSRFTAFFDANVFFGVRLRKFGIHAKHPDWFFREVDEIEQGAVVKAAIRDRAHFKSPIIPVDSYIDSIDKAGCPMVSGHLRKLKVLFE